MSVRVPLLILVLILLLVLGSFMPGVCATAEKPLVMTMRIEGPIEPAGAVYVHRAVKIAQDNNATAIIISLETPGGLDDSMRSIVKDFFASRVPVVVYVSPQGARAASAGAIITLAADVAAMAPGTAIGAAHPVQMGGGGEQPDKTMSKKMENDAAAYARSIALKRHRNVDWAEAAVRESVSATETEAKAKGIIDIIAKDQADLLRQLDGRKVKTPAGEVVIRSGDARTRAIQWSAREKFLHIVANPNVAYILMLIAMYGIIFELNNPGAILPGVAGGIALILALFSFAVLPVNLAGLLLILFGLALLIVDLFTPTHGILTVGGLIAFVVGSLILFETKTPAFQISVWLVVGMAAATGSFFLFAVGAGVRAQKARIVTGKEGMIGQIVEARTDIAPKGKIFAEGSYWNAVTDGEPIREGEMVRIVGMERLLVKVQKEA